MVERVELPKIKGIFTAPQLETGVFKSKRDLAPLFQLPQGGISVDTFQEADHEQTFIRIEPEMDAFSHGFLNHRITQGKSIAEVKRHSEMVQCSLPTIRVAVDGDVQFWFEGERVARIKEGRGLVVNKRYFLGNEELLGRNYVRPELNHYGEDTFSFTFFRKQELQVENGRQNILIAPQFTFATDNFESLNEQIKDWVKNPDRTDEDLRKLVNVKLGIKTRSFYGNEDNDSGGLALSERDPDDWNDDGVIG